MTPDQQVRELLLDSEELVRAVASGRQRGRERPPWRRVELRYVDLKAGRHLQVTAYDATQAHTANHADPAGVVAELLGQGYGQWNLDTTRQHHQLRTTKRGEPVLRTRDRSEPVVARRAHDQAKARLLPEGDPVYAALGLTDAHGRVKPSRQAKVRQVEDFLRLLEATVTDALATGHLRRPTAADPLRVADLGCGNAYLTFAAHRYLTAVRGLPVRLVGVDVKQQSADHNTQVATRLGVEASFVVGAIDSATVDPAPEVVLALHACDTATDEALARAVGWRAPVVLAAPCCHHDLAAQLRRAETPAPYAQLTRHGILRERLADTLTDGIRALLMRLAGYRVDVVEFVDSAHTPRNTLLRAVRTGDPGEDGVRRDYEALVSTWRVRPRLAELLGVADG